MCRENYTGPPIAFVVRIRISLRTNEILDLVFTDSATRSDRYVCEELGTTEIVCSAHSTRSMQQVARTALSIACP